MEKTRYMISDAANIVNVESHVLRYWEDELELQIPRNEMGHRYYTEENIAQFQKIKEWKEQGYQLKAIRIMIHSGEVNPEEIPHPGGMQAVTLRNCNPVPMAQNSILNNQEAGMVPKTHNNAASNTVKLDQFQAMMVNIVRRAVEENNQALGQEVGEQVGERVLKEMNYLMREQDEAEEERFRKLDASIKSRQKGKAPKREKAEKEKRLFGKGKKLNPNLTT